MINKHTSDYLTQSENYKFHLLTKLELRDIWVSTRSKWTDDTWHLDVPVGGDAPNAKITWKVGGGQNGFLTDNKHEGLLDFFRRLTWSLLTDRRGAKPIKPTTVSQIGNGLSRLVPWMIDNRVTSMDLMTPDAADDFLKDLAQTVADEDEEDEIGPGQVGVPIWFLSQVWKQAEVFEGVLSIPQEDPLRGLTASALEKQLATKARGWIPPVPDSVAIPIFVQAMQYLDSDTDTIIDLCRRAIAYQSTIAHYKSPSYRFDLKRRFLQRQIQCLPDFYKDKFESAFKAIRSKNPKQEEHQGEADALRDIVYDISSACIILIQALTGLRSGELRSLKGVLNPETGLPTCLTKRRSKSGLLDIFYLTGTLTKTLDSPEKMEWVAGCALPNSKQLPLAVRAVKTLERLYAPWREQTDAVDLWFTFSNTRGIPLVGNGALSSPDPGAISRRQKEFVLRLVDLSRLPDKDREGINLIPYRESAGTCIRPHQWRKTFAIWLYRYDSNLIAAISEQFKHLSLAMTEEGYLGNDPLLLETLDSARTQETVNFFYEASTGKRKLTGAFAKRIQRHITKLGSLTEDCDEEEGKAAIRQWIATNDLRIYFEEHGKCFMHLSPTDSKCNQLSDAATWNNTLPNYKTRSADVCSGCACFAIDPTHSNFWQRRYKENALTWLQAKHLGFEDDYQIAKRRASQSKQILKVLGLEIPIVNLEPE